MRHSEAISTQPTTSTGLSQRVPCRPHRELDSTNDKHWFVLDAGHTAVVNAIRQRYWYVYKGASFGLWSPDTGVYYASVDAHKIAEHLQQKRRRGHKNQTVAVQRVPSHVDRRLRQPPLSPPTHRVSRCSPLNGHAYSHRPRSFQGGLSPLTRPPTCCGQGARSEMRRFSWGCCRR